MDSVRTVLINNGYTDLKVRGSDYLLKCWNWKDHEKGDRNPSLRVDRNTGAYHCFSCDTKGSLETKFGGRIDTVDANIWTLNDKLQNPEKYRKPKKVLVIPDDAVYDNSYWLARGVSKIALGSEEIFLSTSLDTQYGGAKRTWMAYRDLEGDVFGIEGRAHGSNKIKYLYIGKKGMYPKEPEVYEGTVIGVEGIGDLLNLRSAVLYNVITGFGSGGLQVEDINNIPGLKRLLIAYDSDESGMLANQKLIDAYTDKNLEIEVVNLPKGRDPGSLSPKEIDKYFVRRIYG